MIITLVNLAWTCIIIYSAYKLFPWENKYLLEYPILTLLYWSAHWTLALLITFIPQVLFQRALTGQ